MDARAKSEGGARFAGFGPGAIAFYRGLELDNSRAYWEQHRDAFAHEVRGPMLALVAELADEFGEAKLFRPNRDVRFSSDKSPYKTHQGALVSNGNSASYVEISGDGLCAGAGVRGLTPAQLAAVRRAIAEPGTAGDRFASLVEALESNGFELLGEQVRTAPRGYDRQHPRIRLLRHKEFLALRLWGEPDWLDSPAVVDRVRDTWRELAEFHDWMARHVPPVDDDEIARRGRRT